MMKIYFTKSLLTLIAVAFSLALTAQADAEFIWGGPNSTGTEYDNSTFNGGLHDWITEGLASKNIDSVANAIWVWKLNGSADSGSFWGNGEYPITSPTASNGAAVFDSDFLDNGGDYYTNSILGDGAAPSPHTSVLISPSMDCTGESAVAVLFYQSYRNYDSETSIDVSADGGNIWTAYELPRNDKFETYEVSRGDSWGWIDISETAANQADVRIRFKFAGDYYYWIIDDVALIKPPTNDLAILDYFYAAGSYEQPLMTEVGCDSMGFSCRINNVAKFTQDSVTAYVKVFNENDAVVHIDSVVLGIVGDTTTATVVNFPVLWSPVNEKGTYRMVYSLSNPKSDFYPDDNADGQRYIVSEKTFAKGPRARNYYYPSEAPAQYLAEGSFFSTCGFPYVADMEIAVDSFGFACGDRGRDSISGATVNLWIKKIVGDAYPPSDNTLSAGMTEFDAPNGGWETMGVRSFKYTSEDQNQKIVWITQFLDIFDEKQDVILEPNTSYLSLVVTSAISNSLGLGVGSTDDLNYGGGHGIILQDKKSYGFWTGTSGAPQIIWKLKILTNSTLPTLNENSIQVMPNPVQDELRLQLEFEQPTKVTYALASMTGSLIATGQWLGVQSETQSLDVSNLVNGQYLVRIQTVDGIATKMFIVAR